MSSRSKLTSLNVSNTLICVLQLFCSTDGYICRLWQPALTCVLQHLKIQMQGSLSGWQPALTCVLQRNCAFVHIFIPLLATRTHMRIATSSPHRLFFIVVWQPALTCVLQHSLSRWLLPARSGNPHSHAYCNGKNAQYYNPQSS